MPHFEGPLNYLSRELTHYKLLLLLLRFHLFSVGYYCIIMVLFSFNLFFVFGVLLCSSCFKYFSQIRQKWGHWEGKSNRQL